MARNYSSIGIKSGGGKDGAIRVGTYGNKLHKGPGSAGGADMSTSAAQYQTKIRQKTGYLDNNEIVITFD